MADFEFQVVWPNGSEGPLTTAHVEAPVAEAPAFTETADGELHFDLPELELVDDDAATDEVPDEVAAAVRRAIAAIESASAETAAIAPIDIDAPSVDVFDGVVIDTFDTDIVDTDIADTEFVADTGRCPGSRRDHHAGADGADDPGRVRSTDHGHGGRGDLRARGGRHRSSRHRARE